MPWKETCTLDERLQFVVEYLKAVREMSELCREFGLAPLSGHLFAFLNRRGHVA